jgi:hypothetical protein
VSLVAGPYRLPTHQTRDGASGAAAILAPDTAATFSVAFHACHAARASGARLRLGRLALAVQGSLAPCGGRLRVTPVQPDP